MRVIVGAQNRKSWVWERIYLKEGRAQFGVSWAEVQRNQLKAPEIVQRWGISNEDKRKGWGKLSVSQNGVGLKNRWYAQATRERGGGRCCSGVLPG